MKRLKKLTALVVILGFLGSSAAVLAGESSCSSSSGWVMALLQDPDFLLLSRANPGQAAFALGMASAFDAMSPYEPSSSGAWTWIVDGSVKYKNTEALDMFTPNPHIRTWQADLNASMVGDRLSVTFNVPYRNWTGHGIYELFDLDGESIGLNVIPQYFIFREDSECYDLSVFTQVGYEHVWFKSDPGVDDTDYLNLGVGAMVGKTFDFGRLSLLYGFGSRVNIDGDDMVTGNEMLNTHNTVLTYSFGITENLFGSLQGIWQYTPSLPVGLDANTYKGRASVGYATENWMVEVAYGRTLASTNFREDEIEFSAGYRW
jgi:hypothetical protein